MFMNDARAKLLFIIETQLDKAKVGGKYGA